MSRVNRYDRAPLGGVTRTQEGFLKVDGSKIARTGIQEYMRADGKVVKEFRDPAQVFNVDSLKSYALQPLTNTHPVKMLSTTDAKKHAVGAVGEAFNLDNKWVSAPISVWDADAIKAIEAGRVQLSAGYSCEVVDEPGEYEGQHYDCKQVGIVVNHLALVDAARAGAEARLRLDAGDAECIFDSPISDRQTDFNREKRPMAQLKVDSLTFEVPDANIQTVVDKAIASAEKKSEEKAASEKARADAAEAAKQGAEKERDEAKAKIDALEAKVQAISTESFDFDGAKILMADFRDPEKREPVLSAAIDKKADARAALRQTAVKYIGTNVKLDGKSDQEVKSLVIAKVFPSYKLDGRSAMEINTAFDLATNEKAPTAVDAVRPAPVAAKGDEKPSEPEEARKRSDAMYLSANVKAKK